MTEAFLRYAETEFLKIAYLEIGPVGGWPVVLSHGFPYDVHAYDEVAPKLATKGARVLMPYARGFGPTRFIAPDTFRSGQQAVRGLDIMQFTDILGLKQPILAGYDWGGNASCVAAALWPDRFGGLVSYAGYDIINMQRPQATIPPALNVSVGTSISSRRSAAARA